MEGCLWANGPRERNLRSPWAIEGEGVRDTAGLDEIFSLGLRRKGFPHHVEECVVGIGEAGLRGVICFDWLFLAYVGDLRIDADLGLLS